MKKILYLTTCLLLLTACTPMQENRKILSEKITLITEDNVNIVARFFPTKSDKGIILLHMLNHDKNSWGTLPEELQMHEFNVLALDLRGHGESGLQDKILTKQDFQNMVKDTKAAFKYFETKNVFQVSLVGASIGANTALNYADQEERIQRVVLLSPGLEYRGVATAKAIRTYQRPLLIIVGKQDTYAKNSAKELFSISPSKKELKIFDTEDHGTNLVNNNREAKQLVKTWLMQ